MKKKILIILSIIVFSFSFVACGSKENNDSAGTKKQEETNNKLETPLKLEDEKGTTSENKKKTKMQSCRVFYYDFDNDKMVYVDKKVEVTDGALITALTKELKDKSYSKGFLTLHDETSVTSAKLNREDGTLKVYFNETFDKSTNLGTAAEISLIDSLVNTYGYNYHINRVAIYVNGELFSDQRAEIKDGYFTVDTSKAVEFK